MSGHRPVAPCGTKTARSRHRRRNETCEACKPAPRPVQPCGTRASYKRGCRCEPCTTAHREDQRTRAATYRAKGIPTRPRKPKAPMPQGGLPLAPCGTAQARKRHKRRGEPNCDTCAGAYKPQPCGTSAAYRRHQRANETPCEPCTVAYRAGKEKQRRKQGIPPRDILTHEELTTEIEFLLRCGEGEARILQALGIKRSSLTRRLQRAQRADLINRIFTPWDLAA